MKKKIKISLIVAVHNEERYIGRCLRSIIRQELDHNLFEIIVVDDGSTDKTNYALELFGSDIVLVTHKENLGLPSAVNSGLDIARVEYIVRVDSDDYVNEHFLSILKTYLDFNDECMAVGCDYFLVDKNEVVLKRQSSKENPIACGIMYRHEVFKDIGQMNKEFLFNEEKEFRIRFEKKHKVENINIPLYRYRKHEGNMTNDLIKMKKYDDLLSSKD